jgi:acyl-coenzyme A synthetase/AMP-(fatty) acid ligase
VVRPARKCARYFRAVTRAVHHRCLHKDAVGQFGTRSYRRRVIRPYRIDFEAELPRNAIGKIPKGVLRSRYAAPVA